MKISKDEASQLTEKNLGRIRILLFARLRTKGYIRRTMSLSEAVDSALSYAYEQAIQYDPEKDQLGFSKFVANRCVLRFIDEFRQSTSILSGTNARYVAKVKRIQDGVVKHKGYCTAADLHEAVQTGVPQYEADRAERLFYVSEETLPQDEETVGTRFTPDPCAAIEWEDTKRALMQAVIADNSDSSTVSQDVDIVIHNILPMCEEKDYVTLKELAMKHGVSLPRMSARRSRLSKRPQVQKLLCDLLEGR